MNDYFIYDLEEKLLAMRDIRERAKLSQKEMADILGIDQSRISRLERGEWRKSEHIQTLINLTRVLDNLQQQYPPEEDD